MKKKYWKCHGNLSIRKCGNHENTLRQCHTLFDKLETYIIFAWPPKA